MEVPVSSAVVESLLSQEKISYMCTAKLVHPWQKIKCEVLISENAIYIVPTENTSNVKFFLTNDTWRYLIFVYIYSLYKMITRMSSNLMKLKKFITADTHLRKKL